MYLTHKTVDKGTIYAREVFLDLDTVRGQEEELNNLIARFLEGRRPQRGHIGKTAKDKASGKWNRRFSNRHARADWDTKIEHNRLTMVPHPSYPVSYQRRRAA